MDDLTPEQQRKVVLVMTLIGNTPASLFYPILTEDEVIAILEYSNWNVNQAVLRAAMSAALILATAPYRERTGQIEVWNNASISYGKFLEQLIEEGSSTANLPDALNPYAAGISRWDVNMSNCDPDKNRSPLAQITPCFPWYTTKRPFGYPKKHHKSPSGGGNEAFYYDGEEYYDGTEDYDGERTT